MKKLKIYLLLLITFIIPIKIYASTNTENREDLDDYGVNKWKVTDELKEEILNTKKVDASEKIYDFANILEDEEEKKLYEKIKSFVNKYKTDLVILTDNEEYDTEKENERYAQNFYDYNDFGIDDQNYSGIIIYINNYKDETYYNVFLSGNAQLYFDSQREEKILDDLFSDINNEYYFTGLTKFINYCDKYYSEGKPESLKDYRINDKGKMVLKSENVEVVDRETLENYGVNKKWKITEQNKQNVLNTKKVDASKKIYDFSDILTDEEEIEIYDKIIDFIEKNNMDLVILTDNLPYVVDHTNEEYAVDFYDYNDFGLNFEKYSGIILFRNTYEANPYYDIYLFGEAQLYFNQSRKDELLDGIYYNLHNEYYLKGFNQFISYCNNFYDKGIPYDLKNYRIDDNGDLYYVKPPYKIPFVLIIIIDLITVFISVGRLVKKNQMVREKLNTMEYYNTSSLKFTKKEDTLIKNYVTSYTRSSSSGGSGGGGYHSSHGSSGGGHSSGGGRHG